MKEITYQFPFVEVTAKEMRVSQSPALSTILIRAQVQEIVTDKAEADERGIKDPPKVRMRPPRHASLQSCEVLFTSQTGKDVAHNPEKLEVTES
jgi:hypothetical protein